MPPDKWYAEQLKMERATSQSDESPNWFIERLESERQKFDGSTHPLSEEESEAFLAWHALLQESATALSKRKRQTRSTRLRARSQIVDIFVSVGAEVFLLCTLSTTISKFTEGPRDNLRTSKLQTWWATVPHPQGLTQTAKDVCKAYSIGNLVGATGMHNISGTR
jgi:hypothetical protein